MQIEKNHKYSQHFQRQTFCICHQQKQEKNQVGSAFFFVLICMGTWHRPQAGGTLTWFLATLILGNPEDPTPTTIHNS